MKLYTSSQIQSLRRPKLSGTNGSGVTANASAEETRVVSESNKPRPSRDVSWYFKKLLIYTPK